MTEETTNEETTVTVETTETEVSYGITLIKEAISVIYLTTKEVVEDIENDKKLKIGEIIGLVDNIKDISAIAVQSSDLMNEISDLTSDEIDELVAYTVSLGFLSAKATSIVSSSISIVMNVFEIIQVIKS